MLRRTPATPSRARAVSTAALVTLLSAVLATPLASVSVSPMAVYLDARSRSGSVTLYNPGTRAEEVRIELAFGYPQSDEEGNLSVPIVPEAPPGEPSAAPWLSVFPRRLVLEPGQRQVVRILARPPADLPPGEYWARALVRSRGGQEPIESRQGDVGIRLDVETVVVVAVTYRNGEVTTGVELGDATAALQGDTLVARASLRRMGNAAFLGRVLVEALDEDGDVIGSAEQVLAVYRTIIARVALPLPSGARPARVRYTVDTQRDDLPPGGALPAERVVREIPVT
ncbi:MAG TPA: hypothetical protein VFQ22_05660 [Longimicrobiales bacterium]|nr:hypothetical protein [Longimicrobiales bacterium]